MLFVLVAAFVVWRTVANKRSSAEAHAAVEAGGLLLDVRTDNEFAAGHLPDALNIPVQNLPARLGELEDKKRTVVVYCRSGQRSARAKRILQDAGYDAVVNLGPMTAW